MAKVIVTRALRQQILATFKAKARDIVDLLETVEEQPHKGKAVGQVHGVVIKEIKYEKYRFYCVTDGHVLKFGTSEELARLLIKFVKMSEKKDQQKTIGEIKNILRTMGFERL